MSECIKVSKSVKNALDMCIEKGFNFEYSFSDEKHNDYNDIIMKLLEIADSEGYLLFDISSIKGYKRR